MVWLAEIVEFVRRTRFARRPVPLASGGRWRANRCTPAPTGRRCYRCTRAATVGVEYATTADIDLATDWSHLVPFIQPRFARLCRRLPWVEGA